MRHRYGRDRAHRALARRIAAGGPRENLLVAGARRQRRGGRPRRQSCRALCCQGSVHQAVPARALARPDRASRILGGARRVRRAAHRLRAEGSGAARTASHFGHCRLADARSPERVRGRAGVTCQHHRSPRRPPLVSRSADPAQRRPRQSAARVRRLGAVGGDRPARAGALRASVAARCRVFQVPLAVGRAKARAGPNRKPRRVRARVRGWQRRADPHRSFRQLGGCDGCRHSELSGGPRAFPFRAPADQASLARRPGDAPLRQSRLRRRRQARLARPDRPASRSG